MEKEKTETTFLRLESSRVSDNWLSRTKKTEAEKGKKQSNVHNRPPKTQILTALVSLEVAMKVELKTGGLDGSPFKKQWITWLTAPQLDLCPSPALAKD